MQQVGEGGGAYVSPAQIKRIKQGANPWYEVRLAEGRQNQIRIMFKHFGRLVEKLRRVKIGFLELDLPPGRYRIRASAPRCRSPADSFTPRSPTSVS